MKMYRYELKKEWRKAGYSPAMRRENRLKMVKIAKISRLLH